jgi:hypothetical protein
MWRPGTAIGLSRRRGRRDGTPAQRRADAHLAIAVRVVSLPAHLYSVGAVKSERVATLYVARGFPCQRSAAARAGVSAWLAVIVIGYTFNLRPLHPHPSADLPARRDFHSLVPTAVAVGTGIQPALSAQFGEGRDEAWS